MVEYISTEFHYRGMRQILNMAIAAYKRDGLRYVLNEAPDKAKPALRRSFFGLPLIDTICFKISKKRLRRVERNHGDILDVAYAFEGVGNYTSIRPMHDYETAEAILDYVSELNPETIVEIGAGNGGTLYMWSRGIDSSELVTSIDVRFLTGKRLLRNYSTDAKVRLINDDSRSQRTIDKLKRTLDGASIDLLYIDGDHSYEGVKSDFEMYSNLVKDGGIVMLDDIDNQDYLGVVEAWNEISAKHETSTIGRPGERQGVVLL
jgi:predicted O-methyltransferase YrrM